MKKQGTESGFIKEAVVITIAILTLSYFNIDIQDAANWIKSSYHFIIDNLLKFIK